MRLRQYRYYSCDFETTVYEGQTDSQVWASACVELYSEDVVIHHSIDETFEYFKALNTNIIAYYHNLKFDGSFWLAFLFAKGFKQALVKTETECYWMKEKDMPANSFKYSISQQGQFYSITIKIGYKYLEIRDSLKLLPFSVERIGKSFKTKHKKLHMEYKGFRFPGCVITDEEKEYIKNDVLVVKEALEIMFDEGHSKLTIGSCCMSEFKSTYDEIDYNNFFPNLYNEQIEKETYGSESIGDYIRKSYRGAWCYVVDNKAKKLYNNGTTADVNSLYPSMMHSDSGNYYPVGKPKFWVGDYIPDKARKSNKFFFLRVKTRFYLKPNKLPFIQIKSSYLYRGTECLKSSDIYVPETGEYYSEYTKRGVVHDTRVTLTLTQVDWELIKEHYDLVDCEILDGCYFNAEIGLFDEYINKYRQLKMTSTGARRELAKLFLNNLYGKLASSMDSSFKVAYLKDDGVLGFDLVKASDKIPGYIPCGALITSYARNFTIRAAQANYHGDNQPGFIYADTDSIHCDLTPEKITGINVHENNFCCWKLECQWDIAYFTRQKTYIEHVTVADGEPCEPYYNIKCAGMPSSCKSLFIKSITQEYDPSELNEEQLRYVSVKRSIKDFDIGLRIPGKLSPKRVKSGILLVERDYTMR